VWRGADGVCLAVNSQRRCGFGYTIGDGWKLVYFPQGFPAWMYAVLNVLWVGGWVLGVGWWSAKATVDKATVGTAVAIVVLGVILVPIATGLKTTPIHEWIGAVIGLALGYALSRITTHHAPRTTHRF